VKRDQIKEVVKQHVNTWVLETDILEAGMSLDPGDENALLSLVERWTNTLFNVLHGTPTVRYEHSWQPLPDDSYMAAKTLGWHLIASDEALGTDVAPAEGPSTTSRATVRNYDLNIDVTSTRHLTMDDAKESAEWLFATLYKAHQKRLEEASQ